MNAIYTVALLAACVAAVPINNLRTTTDLNRFLKDQPLTLKDLLTTTTTTNNGVLNTMNTKFVIPTTTTTTVDRDVDLNTLIMMMNTLNTRTTVLTLDELVRLPLFQRYLTLPLFRVHLSQPLFQRFLVTPLFQKLWTIPEFQTLFQNPYLFYKYVYPVVYNTVSHSKIIVDDFVRRPIVDDIVVDDVLNKDVLPIDMINKDIIINRDILRLVKLMKKFLITKPVTDIVTDETIFGKIVDPITGEIKMNTNDIKIVDGKIVPVITDDRKIVIEDILNKLRIVDGKIIFVDDILNKDIVDNKMVLIQEILKKLPVVDGKIVIVDILMKVPVTDKMVLLNILKKLPIVNGQILLEDILTKLTVVDKMVLLNILEKLPIVDDILVRKPTMDIMTEEVLGDKIFPVDTKMNMNLMTIKDLILKRLIMNKMIHGDRKIDQIVPELSTVTDVTMIPELLEKINKMNILNLDNVEKINGRDMLVGHDDLMMTRTPVVDDLLLRKDMLTRVPLTKEMKGINLMDKITGDKKIMYNTIPTTKLNTFDNLDLEIPTTKDVIV